MTDAARVPIMLAPFPSLVQPTNPSLRVNNKCVTYVRSQQTARSLSLNEHYERTLLHAEYLRG